MKQRFFIITWFFLTSTVSADNTIAVFQFNGAIQCQNAAVISPAKAAEKLEKASVKVLEKSVKKLPYGIPNKCGALSGEANVLIVKASDWAKFVKKQAGSAGYGVWVFDRTTVEVYKYDGTLQCGQGKEIPQDTMAKELTTKGIKVEASRKGRDGLAHIAVCGASTGSTNVYSIDIKSLEQAEKLGFKALVTQKMTNEIANPASGNHRGPPQPRTAPLGITSKNTQVPRIW